jgi:hypothetical protein
MFASRFALRNFAGVPTAFYRADAELLDTSSAPAASTPSHHIIGIDVSGSMYYDLDKLKPMVEKLLTLSEFNNPSLRVSLVTYSSKGDVRVHFERATVEDVMAPGSPQLQEIRNLRVRGLTCISQGLHAAEQLIDDGETTCISIHSDGYGNDRSPNAERRDIALAVDALKQHPNTFVNTVAYGRWADFGTLSGIANQLSGTCLQAQNIRQVYEAMHEATGLLAGDVAPVVEAGIGDADFLVFVSKAAKKVLGATETLAVRGLASGDDAIAYRFYNMTEAEYVNSELPEVSAETDNGDMVLAFARAQVALGNLNAAKYGMVAYRDAGLLEGHYRALTGSDVAAMATAMEDALFTLRASVQVTLGYGLPAQGPSVLAVLGTLAAYQKGIRVNVEELVKGYSRRGIKRVPGKREDDGTITPPNASLKTERASDGLVNVSGIEINRNTATINIRLVEDGTLIDNRPGNEGEVIEEIEGSKLDLQSFRNYTLVSDGELNVESLPVRISDKRCFKALADLGMVSGKFDPTAQYDLPLSDLPLVDFNQGFNLPGDTFERLSRLTVVSKILSGITAGSSVSMTPEQIAALKEVHVTPGGFFSPPTTNAFVDLKDALATGKVDTRLSYKVEVGSPEITNLGKLKSGNAYLDRRFEVTDASGTKIKKPKLPMLLDDGVTVGIKSLSARTKLDAVDVLTYPIFAEALGLDDNGHLMAALDDVGLSLDDRRAVEAAFKGGDRETRIEVLTDAQRKVNNALEGIYTRTVSPLVFFVGATGLVPDEFGAKALTAEQAAEKFPTIKLAKAEKEDGTFFVLPNGLLLTVYVKGEHFTTEAGLKAV